MFAKIEDGQEHTDNHAADDDAEKHDEQRLNERHEAGERGVNLLVEEVGDAARACCQCCRSARRPQHADDHAGENRVLAQRGRDASPRSMSRAEALMAFP